MRVIAIGERLTIKLYNKLFVNLTPPWLSERSASETEFKRI